MKAKLIFYLLVITAFSGCCEWFDNCEDPPDPVSEATYEDAIITINSFRNELLASASPNAVALRSLQSARAGEVWIFHECKSTIQNFSASLPGKFAGSDYSMLEDNLTSKTYSFYWENNWTEKHSIGVDIKYDVLEAVIKAAKENSEIHSVDFKLSFKDPKYIRVNNISDLRSEYEKYLSSEGKKAEGNIIISALIKGKMHIEFNALNEQKEKVEFNLSLNTNELLEDLLLTPGYEYFKDRGSSGGFSIIEESGENLTVFAIEYFKIPEELQNYTDITEKIIEFCGSDETLVKVKNVKGYCLSSNENIIDLRIESGDSDNELFLFWKNLTDIPITNFHYTLTIRNRNGQILKSLANRFVIYTINPGVELHSGSVSTALSGFRNFKLEDVEFKLDIVEAKNGFEIICN